MYTIALQKDAKDLKYLRLLGIPSAIQQIAAALVVAKYRADFAKFLLLVNYAIGISRIIDSIANTIR